MCAVSVAWSLLVWASEVDALLAEDHPRPAWLGHAWSFRVPHLVLLVLYAAFGWWWLVVGTMLVLGMIELALSVARCELAR